jgi:antitoxin component of RelBE/YafQ-DinJ toxin-antitoxin module
MERSTSLSTRVSADQKAEFIRRAGELGVSPSQLLKELVEDYLREPKGLPKSGRISEALGEYMRRRCEFSREGWCTFWRFDELKEDPRLKNLLRFDGKRFLAKASPELCSLCWPCYWVHGALRGMFERIRRLEDQAKAQPTPAELKEKSDN